VAVGQDEDGDRTGSEYDLQHMRGRPLPSLLNVLHFLALCRTIVGACRIRAVQLRHLREVRVPDGFGGKSKLQNGHRNVSEETNAKMHEKCRK